MKELAACLSGGHGQNASSPPFTTEGPACECDDFAQRNIQFLYNMLEISAVIIGVQ